MNRGRDDCGSLILRVRQPRRVILAAHLVFTGYGHWLSNDPRGSGSIETRKEELRELGEIHHGRKHVQPSREELRKFYRVAEPRLDHPVLWFDEPMRRVIAETVGTAAQRFGYTLWAFAVCRNHMHALTRTHRDRAELIWQNLTEATRDALRASGVVPEGHSVWSDRPYKVFKYTREQVIDCMGYIERNPVKEGLPRQEWDFVVPCPF
jgi:REP element-mobilizing transposase RayT